MKRISFLGRERNIIGGELNKHLLQGMASAKDVKILDREDDLIYQVDKNLFKMTRLGQIVQFITGLPIFFNKIKFILIELFFLSDFIKFKIESIFFLLKNFFKLIDKFK